MKRKNRYFGIFLLAFLIVGISMGGCENIKEKEQMEQNGQDVQKNPKEAKETDKKVERDIPDMKGRTIRIGLWWDEYWSSDYKTLSEIDEAGGKYMDRNIMQMKLDKVREVEEKWNCKIEWVNLGWDGLKSSIKTLMEEGKADCDIYLTDMQFGIEPIIEGCVQKISDYAPKDSDVRNEQKIFTRVNILGCDDYLFHESTTLPNGAMFMAYNADLIRSLGLEAPEELAKRGEWTWEKFREYAQRCTMDYNDDNIVDIYGYGDSPTLTLQGFLASNNATIAVDDKQGWSDLKALRTVEFLQDLYNKDKIVRPYNQDDWSDNYLALTSGKVAFAFMQPWILGEQKDVHDFEIRICPAPLGPDGDGSMTPAVLYNNYFIPVGVKDPTSVYQVFEELESWFGDDVKYRDNPDNMQEILKDKEQFDIAEDAIIRSNNDYFINLDMDAFYGDIFYTFSQNPNADMKAYIEQNKDKLQKQIDRLIEVQKNR